MRLKFFAVAVVLAAQLLMGQAIPERLKIRGMVYLPAAADGDKVTPVAGATVTAYQGGLYAYFLDCLLNPIDGRDPRECKKSLTSDYASANPVVVQTTVTGANGSYAFQTPNDLPDRDTLVVVEAANGIGAGLVHAHVGSTILFVALHVSPLKTEKKPCRDCATMEKPK